MESRKSTAVENSERQEGHDEGRYHGNRDEQNQHAKVMADDTPVLQMKPSNQDGRLHHDEMHNNRDHGEEGEEDANRGEHDKHADDRTALLLHVPLKYRFHASPPCRAYYSHERIAYRRFVNFSPT